MKKVPSKFIYHY